MPPVIVTLNLTVGPVLPPVPVPALKVAPAGIEYPTARISDISPIGLMTIEISKPLDIPDGIFEDFDALRRTPVPFYGESPRVAWIRNMIKVETSAGWLQE